MKLIIDIPDSFYSDLKENRIDLGAIGCQLLLDKVKNGTPLEEQKPCEDAISRQAVAEVLLKYAHSTEGKAFAEFLISQINNLPPITPQYTDTEIQKMQDLESVEIQTAYEIGKDEGSEVLGKIRAELHSTAEMHEDGDYYLREEWIDEIFDKYKAESEVQDAGCD